jgi:integrase
MAIMDLIDAHLAHITAAGYSPNTITDRGELLRRVDHDLPYGIESATTDELAAWLAHPGWSIQTRATYYGHLAGYYGWATDPASPILDYDPSAGLTRPRVPRTTPRPVSTAELGYALDHAAEPWRLYILLAAYAGLRCCEIARIQRADINEDMIIVRGKGGTVAAIPTHPLIWAAVEHLPFGAIARTVRGTCPSPNYLSSCSAAHFRRIGLAGVTLHRFRHWLGTHSLREGGNLRVTQTLLRHASLATTAIYTQVTDGERWAAIRALPIPPAAR